MIDASTRPRTRPVTPVPLAGMTALAVLVALLSPSPSSAVLGGVLVYVLVACALIDLEQRRIPNRITGPAALLAIGLGLVLDPGGETSRLLWAGLCGGFLLLAALAYPAGMGMGDVKLVFVIGLFLGAPVFVALLVALLATAILGLGFIARRGVRGGRKATLPFGPFLAAGGIVAAVFGHSLIAAYLSFPG